MILDTKTLKEKNLESLKSNEFSIEDCITFANEQFETLGVIIQNKSTGYKIALKKLANEVITLRNQLADNKNEKEFIN